MQCPKCGGSTKVSDVNFNKDDNERYRRRTCKECGHIFYTVEFVVECDEAFLETYREHNRNLQRYRRRKKVYDSYNLPG